MRSGTQEVRSMMLFAVPQKGGEPRKTWFRRVARKLGVPVSRAESRRPLFSRYWQRAVNMNCCATKFIKNFLSVSVRDDITVADRRPFVESIRAFFTGAYFVNLQKQIGVC